MQIKAKATDKLQRGDQASKARRPTYIKRWRHTPGSIDGATTPNQWMSTLTQRSARARKVYGIET